MTILVRVSRVATRQIDWRGRKRPNAREMAAIVKAAREIPGSGRLVAKPGRAPRRLVNPSPAADAYKSFHWGEPPRRRRNYATPRGPLYELGTLRTVEYETSKGGERAIWVHDFSRPRPVLTATADGRLGPILGGRATVNRRGIVG